jgi:DUF1365 family protein
LSDVTQPSSLPPLRSGLYRCHVMHHRLAPRKHRFEYQVFLFCLELDELPELDRRLRWFGHNRRAFYAFRDEDHLVLGPGAGRGIRTELTEWLQGQGVTVPAGARIALVTFPRVLGYVFNPVSFYFVRTAEGEPVCAVAEVGNTFGELKPYLVPWEESAGGRFRIQVPKHFYVSPFSDLEVCFDFRLHSPDERLRIGVNDVTTTGETLLISTIEGERRPFTDRELVRLTCRFPLVTLRIITLIHWQALRLWWKRVPFHRKSEGLDKQQGVFRPHGSLRDQPAGSGKG